MWVTTNCVLCLTFIAFSSFLLGSTTSTCVYNNSSIPRGRPSVNSTYKNFDIPETKHVQMPCTVRSNPPANVQWLFNGKNIKDLIKSNHYDAGPPPEINCDPPSSTLKLWNVRYALDNGNYTCVAKNTIGQSSYTFHLEIVSTKRKNPYIVNKETKYKVYLGTSYNLTCKVQWPGTKTAYAAFWRQGKQANDTDRQELLSPPEGTQNSNEYKYKMLIKNVSKEDNGSWECRAYYFVFAKVSTNKTFTLEVVPCPAGYYCPMNESLPRPCPYGTYNDGTTDITYRCKDCPNRNVTSQRSHNAPAAKSVKECPGKTDVPCPAGYYCPMNESLPRPCPYGTYNDGTTDITYRCKDCPNRYVTSQRSHNAPAAKSVKECPEKTDEIAKIVAGVGAVVACILIVIVCIFYKKKIRHPKYMVWTDEIIEADKEIIYDVFISFSEKDQEFATSVRNKIEENKYKCCYHHRDFSPGESIVKNITDAIYQSTITLVILSPDFMSSKYCKSELHQALAAAIESRRVLPVLYKPCKKLPTEIRSCWTYLEYKREDEKQFWKKLFNAIEKYCSRANRGRGVETNV